MSGEKPTDPMTVLGEGSAAIHEIFLELLSAGFTEWQALRLIGVMLAEQGRQA